MFRISDNFNHKDHYSKLINCTVGCRHLSGKSINRHYWLLKEKNVSCQGEFIFLNNSSCFLARSCPTMLDRFYDGIFFVCKSEELDTDNEFH